MTSALASVLYMKMVGGILLLCARGPQIAKTDCGIDKKECYNMNLEGGFGFGFEYFFASAFCCCHEIHADVNACRHRAAAACMYDK